MIYIHKIHKIKKILKQKCKQLENVSDWKQSSQSTI